MQNKKNNGKIGVRIKRVFLDYASITPIAPEVVLAMVEYSKNNFANPSALYSEGVRAKEMIKESKEKISMILGTRSNEIIFTSGGTESDNLALLGVFEHALENGILKPHIITSTIEHPAILEVCREIERRGGEVTYISVSEEGLVSSRDIMREIKENTILVSVMYANNEIGTIQPIREIGRMIKDFRLKNNTQYPYFHTDACQAGLYISLDVQKIGVDIMTLDGIKMYGPRGLGILYVKSGIGIKHIFFGGGQQGGLRSGTENVEGIIGMARALEVAEKIKESESVRLTVIRDYGIEKIFQNFPEAKLNGSKENRLPNNINICFKNLDAEFAVIGLDVAGISVSYSSSCQTIKENSSSYVISAIGRTCWTWVQSVALRSRACISLPSAAYRRWNWR